MFSTVLECKRIRKGQPAIEKIVVSYVDEAGQPLPEMGIASDYSVQKGEYRCLENYTVEEIPAGGEGRGFRLVKTSTGEVYDVLIHRNGQDHSCDCAGGTYTGRCKHRDALVKLLEANQIPDPRDYPLEALPVFDDSYDPFAGETAF